MKKCIFAVIIAASALFSACSNSESEIKESVIIELGKWKFEASDNLDFAKPDFDDSAWTILRTIKYWEDQGYEGYDGYAWYRTSIYLPSSLKTDAYINDSIQFILRQLDDTDQTFLNGELLGYNDTTVATGTTPDFDYTGRKNMYKVSRRYVISADDPRIKWDAENVIAIRIHDHYLGGGMMALSKQYVSIVDHQDYLKMDLTKHPFEREANNTFKKVVDVKNTYHETIAGTITLKVINILTDEIVYLEPTEISLVPGEETQLSFSFTANQAEQNMFKLEFQHPDAPSKAVYTKEIPYFLTPVPGDAPRVNGPKIYGQSPKVDFLYAIPATGIRPMTFSVDNLPEGLKLDEKTGIITGSVAKAGEYKVVFHAKNEKGEDSKEFTIVIGEDKLALTPPMGWNSWNAFGLNVSSEKVKVAAQQFIDAGLKDHGYSFINIDDGWEAAERTKDGELLGNDKFPDFKALCDDVHNKGLKIGIYSSPGKLTCGKYLGSLGYEQIDADTWAEWGIDYLKYDWCSYEEEVDNHELETLQAPYKKMKKCLDNVDRDIVYSLCQYGWGDVWEWGEEVGGNLWRTTGDIVDTWPSLWNIGFHQDGIGKHAGPGHWNDPDMMIVGWVGWNGGIRPSRLTVSEQYSHVSLWSLLAAPMLLGNDLAKLDDFTISILSNDEVIEINQDPKGAQADKVIDETNIQVWTRELEDGSIAVGIFNVSDDTMDYTLDLNKIGISGKVMARDVWRQKDIGELEGNYTTRILSHGVSYITLSK